MTACLSALRLRDMMGDLKRTSAFRSIEKSGFPECGVPAVYVDMSNKIFSGMLYKKEGEITWKCSFCRDDCRCDIDFNTLTHWKYVRK